LLSKLYVVAKQDVARVQQAFDSFKAQVKLIGEKQEAEAKNQAAIATAVVKFQSDMLAAVDPANLPKDPETGEPLKDKVTVVQAMEAAGFHCVLLDHEPLRTELQQPVSGVIVLAQRL
jgi:hypothetical protein